MNKHRIAIFVKTRALLTVADCFVPRIFRPLSDNAARTATVFTGKIGKIVTK